MAMVKRSTARYSSACSLVMASETQKIRVKIINLWRLWNSKTGQSMEIVFVDEEGTRLHASIESSFVQKYKDLLKEGQSLSINAFGLKEYGGEFRTSPLEYKLCLLRTSRVKPCDDFLEEVPDKYFVDFSKILNSEYEKSTLIDIIGQIISVGAMEDVKTKNKSNTSAKLQLVLRDQNEYTLKCTLWGEHAKKTMAYTEKHMKSIVICVMRFVYVKSYKGEITISNAFSSTQIAFDPNTDQVSMFRESLSNAHQLITVGEFGKTRYNSSVDIRNELLFRTARKNVTGILLSPVPGKAVCLVTINEIDNTKNWFFWAYKSCNLKVQEYGELSNDDGNQKRYNCRTCGDIDNVFPRYYVVFHAGDDDDQTRFLVFDPHAQTLIGSSAQSLMTEFEEENPEGLPYPPSLRGIIGKSCLLKITIKGENGRYGHGPYVVDLYSTDQDLINEWHQTSSQSLMITSGEGCWSENSGGSSQTLVSKIMPIRFAVDENSSVTKKMKLDDMN